MRPKIHVSLCPPSGVERLATGDWRGRAWGSTMDRYLLFRGGSCSRQIFHTLLEIRSRGGADKTMTTMTRREMRGAREAKGRWRSGAGGWFGFKYYTRGALGLTSVFAFGFEIILPNTNTNGIRLDGR